jgi:heat-inducible transcriptional repressor
MSSRLEPALNDRAQHLLKVLVQRYIRDGEPVGSRTLARDSGLDLSPASIRNVMADLEELGMVAAPHTSAGRVPTVKGYRFFVDTLLKVQPLAAPEVLRLAQHLNAEQVPATQLAASASSLLSGITRMAGVVTVPKREHVAWRQIEFIPLGEDRVLTILVLGDGEVQNKVLQLDRRYSLESLGRAATWLNERFAGRDLDAIRHELLGEMQRARASMNEHMLGAIQMAEQMFTRPSAPAGVVVSGETKLMEFAELSNVEKLRRLFEAFQQQQDILHLLDKCTVAEGVQIFIGEESGYRVLDECSVVTAPYQVDGKVVGVLGVIGPTRMAYERVIPIVDVTARLLSAALNDRR